MGKVQKLFNNGCPGTVSRSIDDIIISVKNAASDAVAYGTPVFMTADGAVPFSISVPQDFSSFLGFAVRAADKSPEAYPSGQFNSGSEAGQEGSWKPGDVMEVLVRGGVVVKMSASGARGGKVYIRKTDGRLTTNAGEANSTVLLENVRVKNPRTADRDSCEVIVNERNLI